MRAITLLLGFALLLPLGVAAQTLSTNNIRSLSLEESIRQALQRNLGLQIAQVDVRGARAALFGSMGYYDPSFQAQANYSAAREAGRIDPVTGLPGIPGDRSTHLASAGIVGALPWGMRYDVGGDLRYVTSEIDIDVIDPVTRQVIGTNHLRPGQYSIDTGVSITQPLLRDFWIDSGRALIKLDRADVRISEWALRNRINTVVRDVMLNYYELIFARENVAVFEKALELSRRLAAENKKRVEVGTMAPLEEKQAEAQAATARANLLVTMQQLAAQENRLVNLITDNYEEWQSFHIAPAESLVAVPQAYSLPASWVSALTHRPDFNELKQEAERQGIEVRLAHNQLFPRLDLVGSYGRAGVDRRFSPALEDIRDEELPRYSFGIVFSIPFSNRSARGRYGQATALRDRLQFQLKELHQNILVQVEDAVAAAQSDFERVTATREAAAAAEAAYDAEVKKLENGKSTSFNVLSLQNDLTVARSRQIRALADYNRSLANLYFNEGTILEKARMTVAP
jgi:outer membrane protein TolC